MFFGDNRHSRRRLLVMFSFQPHPFNQLWGCWILFGHSSALFFCRLVVFQTKKGFSCFGKNTKKFRRKIKGFLVMEKNSFVVYFRYD
jgi:hypothetical protein